MAEALSAWRADPEARRVARDPSDRLDTAGWLALALGLATWIVVLSLAPVLPLQDVPDWILQGWLLERLIAGDPIASGVAWKSYPVPNALLTTTAALFVPWFGADAAGRMLAVTSLATFALGAAALARAHSAGSWSALLLFLGVGASTPFLLGYLSFILALGLLALALAAERHAPLSWRAIAGWSLLLFFAHAIAFGVFVLAIGWRHVVLMRSRESALALLPSIACAAWYAGVRLLDEAAAAEPAATEIDALAAAWEVVRWKPFTASAIGGWREMRIGDAPAIALDALGVHWMIAFNLLVTVLLAGAVVRALRGRLAKGEIVVAELVPVAVLLLLFVVAPPVDFFGMINAGERFWLAACLLALPLARLRPGLVAALTIATMPAHALTVVGIWRASTGDVAPQVQSEPPAPWHPFIVPLASRVAVLERMDAEIPPRIDPGYATGMLRNR